MLRLTTAACIAALAVGAAAASSPATARARIPDSFEIVIANGPHAGTYKLTDGIMMCMRTKSHGQLSAAYKDMNQHDPAKVSGAGINIFDPDKPGEKSGEVNVAFGDPDHKHPPLYEAMTSGNGHGTAKLTMQGGGAEVSFEGVTKSGVKLRLHATCSEIAQF